MKFRLILFILLFGLFGLNGLAKDNNPFRVFPNPVVEDAVNIESSQEIQKVEILSMVGNLVQSEELEPSNSVRLKVNLQPGVYLIRITFTDKTTNIKRIRVN